MVKCLNLIFLIIINNVIAEEGIYTKNEMFTQFSYVNIQQTLQKSNIGWIIQFYNSWCGHCQAFASTWRAFANKIKDWDHIFKAGAIDCSLDENTEICGTFGISSFPTLRIYPPNKGVNYTDVSEDRSVGVLMNKILLYLKNLQVKEKLPSSLNFLTYTSDVENIFNEAPKTAKVAVLLQTEFAPAGFAILDLGKNSSVYVRHMEREKDSKMITIEKGQNPEILTLSYKNLKNLTGVIKKKLRFAPVVQESIKAASSSEKPQIRRNPSQVADSVHYVDIENALWYSLRHEVALHKNIDGPHLKALQEFTMTLVRYFPSRPHVYEFLLKFNSFIENSGPLLTSHDYHEALQSAESKVPDLLKERPWKSCAGSQDRYRKYPCGLWTLFHTLTVNSYFQGKDNPEYDPHAVLRAIHGYVKYFFSCRECSNNFQDMYSEDAETYVKKAGDEIKWLWIGHNKVNERLSGAVSEDPEHPKIQFPSPDNCPRCWNSNQLNEDETFDYLLRYYTALSTRGVLTVTAKPGEQGDSTQTSAFGLRTDVVWKSRSNFFKDFVSGPDQVIYLIVYSMVFVTLAILILMMRHKRYLRAAKNRYL